MDSRSTKFTSSARIVAVTTAAELAVIADPEFELAVIVVRAKVGPVVL
jgi:hypothetical protein